ncbi:hypothetical protein BU14_0082s0004 [Porphyra umbilicalis]|uniref:SAM-dependent MTase RsmB/NOP-type domain-containing protein n=1 Tax=Porphyra umbilicalis TaxID=2786 RepID=A0A1X6PEH9_PORUM|nr:hypothetical protein BU14_0082s0004 [Porphyra umbilicalis]|eukprot:OSX79240.1 hypothetical protein BU14_0082s0004 [Porphyra umbilicalis]
MAKGRRLKRGIGAAVPHVPTEPRQPSKKKRKARAGGAGGGGGHGGGGGGRGGGGGTSTLVGGGAAASAPPPRPRVWVPRDWEAAPAAPGSRRSTTYAQAADRAVYALVLNTLRHRRVLADVASRGALSRVAPRLGANPALGLVLLYDLLLAGGGRFAAHGPVERALGRARPQLARALRNVLADAGVTSADALALPPPTPRPRYVRANALRGGTTAAVLAAFGGGGEPADGGGDGSGGGGGGGDGGDGSGGGGGGDGGGDGGAPPPPVAARRRSCLPVAALLDSLAALPSVAGWAAADATAAPGHKTVQLAGALAARAAGPVTAVERDARRARTLRSTLATAGAGADAVRVVRGDWLDGAVTAAVAGVRLVLVDPSCSGSGTRERRMDRLVGGEEGGDAPGGGRGGGGGGGDDAGDGGRRGGEAAAAYAARLGRLAAVQGRLLGHALALPSALRVVYSTCSVEAAENEAVVAAALAAAAASDAAVATAARRPWRLHPALPAWTRRGVDVPGVPAAVSRACLRADEKEDETDGFFVAVFARDEEAT